MLMYLCYLSNYVKVELTFLTELFLFVSLVTVNGTTVFPGSECYIMFSVNIYRHFYGLATVPHALRIQTVGPSIMTSYMREV